VGLADVQVDARRHRRAHHGREELFDPLAELLAAATVEDDGFGNRLLLAGRGRLGGLPRLAAVRLARRRRLDRLALLVLEVLAVVEDEVGTGVELRVHAWD